MKLFECQNCGQPLYFENTRCEHCFAAVGYLPELGTLSALSEEGPLWRPMIRCEGLFRKCANAQQGACNWLVAADGASQFCVACQHNRTIPDLSNPQNLSRWRKLEQAKHHLFYSLMRLRLPLTPRPADPTGLVFDFLDDEPSAGVKTGHADGAITIRVREADDDERERTRLSMGERYRTLLGHFRHESGHFFWDRLIARSPMLEEFRALFGDERQNYEQALQRHYDMGPPEDWREHFVSPYASSHPWEDFAETWAHYFHLVDTLETAGAFGLRVRPHVEHGSELSASFDFDPYTASVKHIVECWLPLTYAMTSINRSMGLQDFYPFILTPEVVAKLNFIFDCIHKGDRVATTSPPDALDGGAQAPLPPERPRVEAKAKNAVPA